MVEWDDLRIFLAVYRSGQLTAAGRALGADQSTVGRRIAALEARLEVKLFFRNRDGLVPTPAAERLLPRAQRMEEEAFAIARENAGEELRLTGPLRITAPDGFGAKVIAPLASKFAGLHPEMDLEVLVANKVLSLSKHEADIAVRVGTRPQETGNVARKLVEYGIGLYASHEYVERKGMPKPDYRKHDVVQFDLESRIYPDCRWLFEHAKHARVALRANTDWVVLSALREGLGFGLLPTFHIDRDDFVEVRAPSDTMSMSVWLVMHRDLHQTPKVRACADFLVAELGRLEPWLMGDKRARPK